MIERPQWRAEFVTPLVTFLASRQCSVNQAVYGAVGGCYSRIYLTQTQGWLAPRDRPATPEEVMAHLGDIEDRTGSLETRSVEEDLHVSSTRSMRGAPSSNSARRESPFTPGRR